MMRLGNVDAGGTITRCYWGDREDLAKPDVREAPEPWAVEGVNYDQAKADYEAKIAAEDTRQAELSGDATAADLMEKIKTATLAQINTYVDTNVTDLASARALFKRILVVMSLMLKG